MRSAAGMLKPLAYEFSDPRLLPRPPELRPRPRPPLFPPERDDPDRDDPPPLPLRDLDEDRLLEPLRV